MMIRNVRDPQSGQQMENMYEVIDEKTGEQQCAAFLELKENEQLYSNRPLRIRLRLEGEVEDQLIGAVLARAREIRAETGIPARLYVSCRPEEAERVEYLAQFGFRDDDGQVRMRRELTDSGEIGQLPAGCVMVNDGLEPLEERRFFLERYNELYGTRHDLRWLGEYTDRDDFMRILAVAPGGLVNETVVWREGSVGVIGFIQTSKRWRRRGIAGQMLRYAARYFQECGIRAMTATVHVRIPGLLRTFESAGFYQEKLLLRYPGIDL